MSQTQALNTLTAKTTEQVSNQTNTLPIVNEQLGCKNASQGALDDDGVDLYGVLGLKHTASHSEVELAFKKKASECLPSKNPQGNRLSLQRKFNDVTYAYSILVDPARRDDYDQIKHYHFSKQQALQQFEDFFKQYGLLPDEEEFFRRHYPNRKRTYYDVLDLPKNATDSLIRESFRKKVISLHPSNFAGEKHREEAFRQLCEAYYHLSDKSKRRLYDKLEFQRVPTFQAHAQFNNYFGDSKEYENQEDRNVLGEFVRKTSLRENRQLVQPNPQLPEEEPHHVVEEVTRQTVESIGPEGPTRKTITRKTSVIDGKTNSRDVEQTRNPDGTISITQTVKDITGEHTNKYTLPKDSKSALFEK